MRLRVHRRARAAVDEHELRPQDEAFAVHVGTHGDDTMATVRVDHLLLARDHARSRVRREQDGARHDERILVFLADLLPVGRVRE